MKAIEFFNDEHGYLEWLRNNPEGFVVNTYSTGLKNSYFVLHRSTCYHISNIDHEEGAYTERAYKKVCSNDLDQFIMWFEEHNYVKYRSSYRKCKNCFLSSGEKSKVPFKLYPDQVGDENEEVFTEGGRKQIVVNAYERSRDARERCLEYYGYACSVCNMDFYTLYGDIGRNFIHVHHLKEISQVGSTFKIDPIRDLRPVCPNCHAMLHQKNPCFEIEELRTMIESVK